MKTSSFNPDVVDTRTLFRVYASSAAIAGLILWLGPVTGVSTSLASTAETKRALLQMAGAMLVAVGCASAGLGEIEDPRSRHRALGCFAFAHAIALAGVVSVAVIHGGLHEADIVPPVLVVACIVLFYFWQTGDGYRAGESMQFTRLFAGPGQPDDHLRSAYEEQIREAASQEERHRLARDLHDSVKQQIFAMQAAAATVQARFDSDAAGARDALDRLRESGREAMAEMEAMLDSLRSTPLTTPGLVDALKKQGEALQFRTGARVSFEIGALPPDEALAPGAQPAIFKVAQEAFANIGRHARASRVVVALGAENDQVTLRIADDGAGFSTDAAASGMGLANMRERARAFDGLLDVASKPGGGTRVTLRLPFAAWARADVSAYRRRIFVWAGTVLFIGVMAAVAWRSGHTLDARMALALLLGNLVILARVILSYVRASRRAEESPWIESPSHS
jgi:signal transduction histidine kinase